MDKGGFVDIIQKIVTELTNQQHKKKTPEQIEAFLRKHLVPIAEVKTKKTVPKEYTEKFKQFWYLYPRKDAKRAAFKIFWNQNEPDCIGALIWQVKTWNEGYIPMASTYLNQKRYEDEREICPAEDVMSQADMLRML